MRKKILIVTAVISLVLGIFALDGLCKEEKAGMLQKIKTAYNNFRKKKEIQKAEAQTKAQLPKIDETKAQPKAESPEARAEKKEMTRDEMLADLKESIEENDELFDIIPELKSEKSMDGKFYYTFKGVKLEELSKEDLDKLSTRMHQTLVKLRTERIERQLETVRQVQNIQKISTPSQVQGPPQVQQPPRPPAQPSSPPKAPSMPPAPPSRR